MRPRLATLLAVGLCDATRLVERLGDVRAAALFRELDMFVLRLQPRWRGTLVERGDHLLLMFDRPVDALGFVLDYRDEANALGVQHAAGPLQVRAGVHLGEVVTWRDSAGARRGVPEAEIEGRAKTLVKGIAALARPGQILLSSTAQPLAERAAGELGPARMPLVWKSHGRWRMPGLPGTEELFEAATSGQTPRAPRGGVHGRRVHAAFRDPRTLALPVLLLSAAVAATWFMLRPQPAIAFAERDWVVVADVRNLTRQPLPDDAIEQALRLRLEQSRYVNVLTPARVNDTLERMRYTPETVVDRDIASEVAVRDGARAVFVPTVSEAGGRFRLSIELVDPHTRTTVHAESADGRGAASLLASADALATRLRTRLGETLHSIERSAMPMPAVTTRDLEALRLYMRAQQVIRRGRYDEAHAMYEAATRRDPQFALAWIGQVRALYGSGRAPAALVALRRAQALRALLPPREALYLDAWGAEFDAPADATARWVALARRYPDYFTARLNAAMWLYQDNRFEEALEHAIASDVAPLSPVGDASDTIGRLQLGLERYEQAEIAFEHSFTHTGGSQRRRVAAAAAKGDFERAREYERALDPDDLYGYIERTTLAVDEGRLDDARRLAAHAVERAAKRDPEGLDRRQMLVSLGVTEWLAGDAAAALRHAHEAADRALAALAQPFDANAEDDAATALAAALLAQRLDDGALATRVLDALRTHTALMRIPALDELSMIVRAGQARAAGRPREAIALLRPYLTGHERFQTRAALLQACRDAGDTRAALEHARWLQRRRGLAYSELECGYCLQALNIADSASAFRSKSKVDWRR